MTDNKKPLMGLSLYELKEVAKQLGMPAFTGGQMAKWLYTQHVSQIDDMTNISKANRERLAAKYTIGYMEPIDCQKSKDGTSVPHSLRQARRDSIHPRPRPCHAVRVVAGGM